MFEIQPVTAERLGDVSAMWGPAGESNSCWCMWFLMPVSAYDQATPEAKKAMFEQVTRDAAEPVGVLAYADGVPVGWAAAGPRSRYSRVLRTPTYAGRDPAEDDAVWLVPCFWVAPGRPGDDVARALLEGAVVVAAEYGARAVEGFPVAVGKRVTGNDKQVGAEAVFAACGFDVVRRPSAQRVVMRRACNLPRPGFRDEVGDQP